MKAKILVIIICTIVLFGVCGCSKKIDVSSSKGEEQKEKKKTDEELISESLCLKDLNLIHLESPDSYHGESETSFENRVSELRNKPTSNFSKRIIELYNKQDITKTYENGSNLERLIILGYNSIFEKNFEYKNMEIKNIFYNSNQFDDNYNLKIKKNNSHYNNPYAINPKQYSYGTLLIFELINKDKIEYIPFLFYELSDGQSKPLYTDGEVDTNTPFFKPYESISSALNDVNVYNLSITEMESVEKLSKVNDDILNNIFTKNNYEFARFIFLYQEKYYNDLDNRKQQYQQEKKPQIGMSHEEVKKSSWGSPDKINKDTYSWGTKEQWVYNQKGYIYFENGKVTSISER